MDVPMLIPETDAAKMLGLSGDAGKLLYNLWRAGDIPRRVKFRGQPASYYRADIEALIEARTQRSYSRKSAGHPKQAATINMCFEAADPNRIIWNPRPDRVARSKRQQR